MTILTLAATGSVVSGIEVVPAAATSTAAPGSTPLSSPPIMMFLLRRRLTATLTRSATAPGQRAFQRSKGVPVAGTGRLPKLAATSTAGGFAVSIVRSKTRATYSRRPPLPKNARAASASQHGWSPMVRPPKARSYSVKLVTSTGPGSMVAPFAMYGTGPYCVRPVMPKVLVGTPSIERDRKLVSST